jgi:hypothetical protein
LGQLIDSCSCLNANWCEAEESRFHFGTRILVGRLHWLQNLTIPFSRKLIKGLESFKQRD